MCNIGFNPTIDNDKKHSIEIHLFHFHKDLPDVAYLFAWNHREEIFAKEKDFVRRGGKWISHVSI